MCLCAVACMSGKSATFKAACYNVDGLPFFNNDGPKSDGTKAISERIAQEGWDFFGVSEDFGFHEELISALEDYNIGKYRGTVTTSNSSAEKRADTDGLCFFAKKTIGMADEKCVSWKETWGTLLNGADECIDKGYRTYVVTLAEGLEVDVYIMHMNSGDKPQQLAARASQLQQLAEAIVASDNKRPIILMGDFNCRWTRDPMAQTLAAIVNADPRFTLQDPWVDFHWGGWYPTYGNSITVDNFGNQKGEVVDKVLYINNTDAEGVHLTAKSYLQDDSFQKEDKTPLADHHPIVIEFTIEDGYETPEPGTDPSDKGLTGEYFLRNAASGQYLTLGGAWGTHAIQDNIGNRINIFKGENENEYGLRSTAGFICDVAADHPNHQDIYMDAYTLLYYTFTPTGDPDTYTITYLNDTGEKWALGTQVDPLASVTGAVYAEGDKTQQWTLVPEKDLVAELDKATADNPMDATFLFRGHNIGVNDSDNNRWVFNCANATYAKQEMWGPNDWNTKTWVYRCYNTSANSDETKNSWTVENTVTALPNGIYEVECQMITDGISVADGFTYELNGVAVDGVKSKPEGDGTLKTEEAVELFKGTDYNVKATAKVTDGTLNVKLTRAPHKDKKSAVAFDNFKLTYFGADQSGVASVADDNRDAAPVYFNLQGMRIESPTKGIYIVKRGDKVSKEVIR